jgi:NADPH2:quinone reductase
VKAIVCAEFGPPERLIWTDRPSPAPGPGQVKIATEAAGLNFPDTLIVAAKYQLKPALPFTPGMECAGRIVSVGDGVQLLAPGTRVMATMSFGAMAEEVLAPARNVFPIPDEMSFAQAAGFPVTYGTAYHALADRGKLQPGETLLVLGAAGGVGLNAVELGKLMGARVIAAAGSAEKLKLAQSYGADDVIDYTTESIRDRVNDLTGKRGADVIFDAVGGDAFDAALKVTALNGRLLVVGFASGRIPQAPANLILLRSAAVVGVAWGGFAEREPEKNRANLEQLFAWFRAGKLKPHISRSFPLRDVAAAMQFLLSRQATGKVVLTVKS